MGRPGPRDSTVVHRGGLPRLECCIGMYLALIVGLGTRRHLFSDDTKLQQHTNVSTSKCVSTRSPPPSPAAVASVALFLCLCLTCRPTAPRRTFSAIYGHKQSFKALQNGV